MPSVNLNEMDLRAFLTAFNAIAEVSGYDFDDETEYRLAIANLVGELRSQLPIPSREFLTVTPRVSLAAVLESKYQQWLDANADGSGGQSADSLIGEYLDRHDIDSRQFTGGADAGDAIRQFRSIVTAESAAGWDRYELALCASTREEIDRLTLPDLLKTLLATAGKLESGRSLWSRWKK